MASLAGLGIASATPTTDRQLTAKDLQGLLSGNEPRTGGIGKYDPTHWWQQHRNLTLEPVMRALASHDVDTLQKMYENFFRDDCSTGLLPVQRVKNNYFGHVIADFYRRLYLVDALYRLDYWKTETSGSLQVSDLAGPGDRKPLRRYAGRNPYQSEGSEYQHYCAQRIASFSMVAPPSLRSAGVSVEWHIIFFAIVPRNNLH